MQAKDAHSEQLATSDTSQPSSAATASRPCSNTRSVNWIAGGVNSCWLSPRDRAHASSRPPTARPASSPTRSRCSLGTPPITSASIGILCIPSWERRAPCRPKRDQTASLSLHEWEVVGGESARPGLVRKQEKLEYETRPRCTCMGGDRRSSTPAGPAGWSRAVLSPSEAAIVSDGTVLPPFICPDGFLSGNPSSSEVAAIFFARLTVSSAVLARRNVEASPPG